MTTLMKMNVLARIDSLMQGEKNLQVFIPIYVPDVGFKIITKALNSSKGLF